MSDNETTKTARRARPRRTKAAAAALDTERLAAAAAEIAGRGGADLGDLEARFAAEDGLTMEEGPGGLCLCTMQGVAASGIGRRLALINWSNAARRAVLKGGAA